MENNSIFKKNRLWIFFTLFFIVVAYIVVTFGILAFKTPDSITTRLENSLRGSILDRNSKPLAVQANFYHITVTPSDVANINDLANKIAPVIDISPEKIVASINSADRNFLYLKRDLDENEKKVVESVIRANEFSGIGFEKISKRFYPENALASQVIGFMGTDGDGLAGIEYSQDEVLQARSSEVGKSPVGNNVFLTIDANLQYKLEQIANKSKEETQAESFMLVAADANNGEILSYISLPSTNLNDYKMSSDAERIDRPAVLAYEPGSVFKIFSVASFIESGSMSPSDTFVCDGVHTMEASSGETSKITCLGHHGRVTAREALQYSCNDALAQMSETMDADEFLAMLKKFGFGEYTFLEVPSETRGSIKNTNDKFWSIRSKQTMSIGQELSVSALQMVQATTAIANEGVPLQLTLISKITDSNSNILYEHTPEYKERVVSKETADYVLSCMATTAQYGTGTKAALEDISIGVKTGTAQMIDSKTGKYSDTDFVSNVTAVFPVEDPQIVLYIVVTKAQGETLSGRIVAPVIAEAANTIIDHLGLARANAASLEHSGLISVQADKTPVVTKEVPSFIGLSKRALTPLLSDQTINYIIEGDGWVVAQEPAVGTPITEGMTITLYLE